MHKAINISENIYWIGVNDRRTHLFENLWPLPKGVSYNSYFIDDEKTALIDTVEVGGVNDFIEKIEILLNGKARLDYLVINHMEPDHSGAIKALIARFPEVAIIGNKKTFPILYNYFGVDSNIIEINEDSIIELGKHQLKFFLTPMLHWPETMMTYETNTKVLFTGDAFGSFGTLDGGIFDDEVILDDYEEEVRRYYSNIVGKYWNPVQKAFEKLSGTDINIIAATHGPVWRSNKEWILSRYQKWSKFEADGGLLIVFGSMYGNTEKVAEAIARKASENGIKDIRIYDASKTHLSYIINDVFKYRTIVLGSSAYNGSIFPAMEHVISKIQNTGVKNRYIGIIGSATWGGGGVKALKEFAEKLKWEIIGESIQVKGAPKAEDLQKAEELADMLSEKAK